MSLTIQWNLSHGMTVHRKIKLILKCRGSLEDILESMTLKFVHTNTGGDFQCVQSFLTIDKQSGLEKIHGYVLTSLYKISTRNFSQKQQVMSPTSSIDRDQCRSGSSSVWRCERIGVVKECEEKIKYVAAGIDGTIGWLERILEQNSRTDFWRWR